jgi:hypothetical protein
MPRRPSGRSRQPDLFPRSKRPAIELPDNHPIVVLTDTVDWTEMEVRAEKIREKKLKNAAGRPPQLRAMLGALALMAIRNRPYRELEDQIRYYAPARYLCGLTETDWTPDFTTVHDFAQLMGEDGVRLINESVVEQAVALGLADPKVAVADMTAQEAAIPYPNEMGLLGGFIRSLEGAAGKVGKSFKAFLVSARGKLQAAKEQVCKYRLFAKNKTKQGKDRMVAKMTGIIEAINQNLGKALDVASDQGRKLRGHALVARRKLAQLHDTMAKLCTPSCAAKWARQSSSGCRGGSRDYAAASSLPPSPKPKPISRTPRSPCVLSRILSRCSARPRAPTPTIAPATVPRTWSDWRSSASATWDWPPEDARHGRSRAK